MDEFGLGNIIINNAISTRQYRILIHFYEDLLNQLMTEKCSSLEIMLKYSVEYRSIDDFTSLNLRMDSHFYKKVVFYS